MKSVSAFIILFFIFSNLSFGSASDYPGSVPTSKESIIFKKFLQKSGLLLKNHKIKNLNPGPAFQVIRHACIDGDDIYLLSFDSGITLITPKNESITQSYPSGAGGSWTPIFKYDSHSKYFHFLGASTHRWAHKVLKNSANKLCPQIEVGIHGSFCNKAGSEECWGILKFDEQNGYSLVFPKSA